MSQLNRPSDPFGDGDSGSLARRSSRDNRGRFLAGNSGGPGNPNARRVARLREALLRSVTEDDIEAIVASLVASARDGDIVAAREVLDRCLGRPVTPPPSDANDDEGRFTVIIQTEPESAAD